MDERQEIPLTRVEKIAVQALAKEQQRVNREIQEVTADIAARLGLTPHALFTTHDLDPDGGVVRVRPLPPQPEPQPENVVDLPNAVAQNIAANGKVAAE